jgi:hypothetical protein
MIRCNSICSRIENEKVIGFDSGQKYCGLCQYYITTTERICPCCHAMYRSKRRNNKRRQGELKIGCEELGVENVF